MVKIFLRTALFLSPVYAPIMAVGGFFGLYGVLAGLLLSFTACAIIVLNVDRITAYMYRARPAPGEMSEIRETVKRISNSAGVAQPSIYLTEQALPGSFITGKNKNKTILVVPKRLLDLLDAEEVEAALAYNIGQIDDGIRLRTLAALISGVMTMTASAVRWGAVFTGFGDYDEPAPKMFGFFAMGLAAPPAASMVHSVAQHDTDARACAIGGKPDALISAVRKLENNNARGYPSLGFICLIDPEKENFFEQLFNIHPSMETRTKNLTGGGEAI